MITGRGSSTERRKCEVCGTRKTGNYKSWSYLEGIEITVPVCGVCNDKIGLYLDSSMDIHLKGIRESIRHSFVITSDEKKLIEYAQKLRKGV